MALPLPFPLPLGRGPAHAFCPGVEPNFNVWQQQDPDPAADGVLTHSSLGGSGGPPRSRDAGRAEVVLRNERGALVLGRSDPGRHSDLAETGIPRVKIPSLSTQVVRGKGVYLYDEYGKEYLDTANNVASCGHCHPAVSRFVSQQLEQVNTNFR